MTFPTRSQYLAGARVPGEFHASGPRGYEVLPPLRELLRAEKCDRCGKRVEVAGSALCERCGAEEGE